MVPVVGFTLKRILIALTLVLRLGPLLGAELCPYTGLVQRLKGVGRSHKIIPHGSLKISISNALRGN